MARERKIFHKFDNETGEYTGRVVGSGTLHFNAVRDVPGMTQEIWDGLPEIAKTLFGHGICQKLPDTASALRGPAAYAAMKEVAGNLRNGVWSNRGGFGTESVDVLAYAAVTGKTPESAAEAWGELSDNDRKAERKKVSFKLEKNRIEGERLQKAAEAEKAAEQANAA